MLAAVREGVHRALGADATRPWNATKAESLRRRSTSIAWLPHSSLHLSREIGFAGSKQRLIVVAQRNALRYRAMFVTAA
jgi:hypothetical protein